MHSLFFYSPECRGRHARLVYKIRSREGLPAVAYQLRVSHLIVPHLYFPVLYHGLRRIVKSFLLGDLECTDGVPIGSSQALCVIESDIGGVIGKRERKGRTTATIGLRETTLANPFIRPKAPLGDLRRGMGRFRTGFIEPPAILPRRPMGSMRHAEYRTLLGHRICLRAYAGR